MSRAEQRKDGEGKANRGEKRRTYEQKAVEASRIKEEELGSWMEVCRCRRWVPSALQPGSRCSAAFFPFPISSLSLPGFQIRHLLVEV
jgi:hypothetical protein